MAAKPQTAVVPSYDAEQYKLTAESINISTATLVVTSKLLLERGVETEDDYVAARKLGDQAAEVAANHERNFEPACKSLNALHKTFTKLREHYVSPWRTLADTLRGAARKWDLAAQAAKQQVEQQLLVQAKQNQKSLAEEAQDLIDQGFVKEGRLKLMQAQSAGSMPVLPDPVPEVDGKRIVKYKGSFDDLTAIIQEIAAGRMELMWEVKGEMRPILTGDQVVLNAIVARLGPNLKCPGIKIERDVTYTR